MQIELTEEQVWDLVYCLRSTIHHEPGMGETELAKLRDLDARMRGLIPEIPEAV